MRALRLAHALLTLHLLAFTTAASCVGQRAGSALTRARVALPEPPGTTSPHTDLQEAETRATTFLERLAWGAGAGFLGVAAASAIVKDEDEAWVALPLIGAASAGGVMLVTSAHEGARPWSTLLGTAVVMTVPALMFSLLEDGGEVSEPQLAIGFAVLLSAPLGAALGHGLGTS